MKLIKTTLLIIATLTAAACSSPGEQANGLTQSEAAPMKNLEGFKKAYFASGCFWCVEAVFESVKGVEEVISGYSGGEEKNPTYQQVSSGQTRHAESVEVYYDPAVVSYETLLKVFFGSQDPTTPNRQGPDRGPQYRSVVFFQTPEEKQLATDYIKQLNDSGDYSDPIVTEVVPFTVFYPAEDYHQDYEKNHPENPYVRNVSIPRINKFKQKFPELLK